MKITAESGKEVEISKYIEGLLLQHITPRLEDIEKHFGKAHGKVVDIQIQQRELSSYDALLQKGEVLATV